MGRHRRRLIQLTFPVIASLVFFPVFAVSFQHGCLSKQLSPRWPDTSHVHKIRSSAGDGNDEESTNVSSFNRRCLLELTSVASLVGAFPFKASAETSGLDCLLDLPPVSSDCVRIYLCRHGQTENNRLRRVQGARVNPPLNKFGEAMAVSLGEAFARLDEKNTPRIMTHSTLMRATQTAQIASKQIHVPVRLESLVSLGEVDFGPIVEGKKIVQVRAEMARTYTAWAAGLIDTRPEGGGDSGREILNRAVSSLHTLVQDANDNGGSVIAVTHSTYLRMMLAILLDMSLAQAATIKLSNGCINVVDLKRSGASRLVGPKSALFGGPLSQAPSDFELQVPIGDVIRIDENRHLMEENRQLEGRI